MSTPKIEKRHGWTALEPTTIHCNFKMAGPDEVWVIKLKSGRFLRWLTTGCAIGVKRSLATRFDSATWAATMMSAIDKDAGARVRRLRTKQNTIASYFTYTKPPAVHAVDGESTLPNGPDPKEGT